LCFQALSYSNSEWLIKDRFISIDAFSIFTNLSFQKEKEILNSEERYKYWWSANLALINHANVGELRVNEYKNILSSWYLYFSGGIYCKWDENSGAILRNPNVIGKCRIGNIS